MVNKSKIKIKGTVLENLPNTLFRVKLESGETALCHLSGKMRINYIRIIPGDKVEIELSPHDKTRGRIVYRYK